MFNFNVYWWGSNNTPCTFNFDKRLEIYLYKLAQNPLDSPKGFVRRLKKVK